MKILQVRQQFRSSCSSSCPPPSCQFPLPATNSISPLYTLTSTSSLPSTSPTRWEIDVIMEYQSSFLLFLICFVSSVIFILPDLLNTDSFLLMCSPTERVREDPKEQSRPHKQGRPHTAPQNWDQAPSLELSFYSLPSLPHVPQS